MFIAVTKFKDDRVPGYASQNPGRALATFWLDCKLWVKAKTYGTVKEDWYVYKGKNIQMLPGRLVSLVFLTYQTFKKNNFITSRVCELLNYDVQRENTASLILKLLPVCSVLHNALLYTSFMSELVTWCLQSSAVPPACHYPLVRPLLRHLLLFHRVSLIRSTLCHHTFTTESYLWYWITT